MKRILFDFYPGISRYFAVVKRAFMLAVLLGLGLSGSGQTYCPASADNCSYENIRNVSFAGIDNSSGCGMGYANYTHLKARVAPGQVYPLSVTIQAYGLNYITVFIDWNQDGHFDPDGERYEVAADTHVDGPHELDIRVPDDAVPGETRMRVMVSYVTPGNSVPDACDNYEYGEVEDYTIDVDPSAPVVVYSWSEKFQGGAWQLPTDWEMPDGYWYITEPEQLPVTDGNLLYAQLYRDDFQTIRTRSIGPVAGGSVLTFIYNLWDYDPPFLPPPADAIHFVVAVSTDGGSAYTDLGTVHHDGTAGWKQYTRDLSSYEGQDILIRLTANHTGGYALHNVGFDNFYVGQPVCSPILNPAASGITPTTATLSWSIPDSHPAEGYEYYYSNSPTPPHATTEAIGTVATNEVLLNSLDPGEVYYFWVRGNCGAEDKSEWSMRLRFATELELNSPWSEDFPTTDIPSGWHTAGWEIGTAAQIPGSQGNIIYRNLYNQAVRWTGTFHTPNIVGVQPGDELSFTWSTQKDGQPGPADAGSGTLTVSLSTDYGATYTPIETISNDGNPGWKTFRYALGDYVGEKVKIRIDVAFSGGDYYFGFDDFSIAPSSDCPSVTILTTSAVTASSARITWSTAADGRGYEYYYGPASTPPDGDSTPSGATTDTFLDLMGLDAGTTYYVWVRAICDSETRSAWSAVMAFATVTVADVPWFEDFSGTGSPQGWQTNNWSLGAFSYLDGLSGKLLYQNIYWNSPVQDRTFITPAIGEILAGQQLTFRYQLKEYDDPSAPATGSGKFVVSVSTDFGETYSELSTIENNGMDGAQEFHYDLDDYVGEHIRIRIVATRYAGDYFIGFDDFRIGQTIVPLQHTDGVIYVKEDGIGSGANWTDATSRLQAAINLLGVSQVWVAAGQYPAPEGGFVMKNDVAIYGGFPASGATSMAQRQWAQHPTVLSGRGLDRVMKNVYTESNPLTPSALLDGFIVEHGLAIVSHDVYWERGGGIYNSYASPTLTNLIIRNNSATVEGNGGGMFNADYSAPVLTNVLITDNLAGIGGGMQNSRSAPILTNVTIAGNNAPNGGSAMANQVGSHPLIRNSILYGNSGDAEKGSFIYNYYNILGNIESIPVYTHSIIEGSGGSGSWRHDWENGEDGGRNMDTDPQFVNTAGGDFSLLPTSRAIDNGSNTFLSAAGGVDLSHIVLDLAGLDRFYDSGPVDIGAFEFQGESLAPGPDEHGIVYVKATAAGTGTGKSWENALSNLQQAIDMEGVQQVWVAAGTYMASGNGFRMKNGVAIYGGFPDAGEPDMDQRNWREHETILSGDGVRTVIYNLFGVDQPLTSTARLDGFTISDGRGAGGIHNRFASPSLFNLIIKNNSGNNGGGIGNINNSSPTLVNVIIRDNVAASGGGIRNERNSSPTLRNVIISGNTTVGAGAGIFNYYDSRPVLINVTITGNTVFGTGSNIGGVFSQFGSYITAHNSIIWDNGLINTNANVDASSSNNIIQSHANHNGSLNPRLLHTDNPTHGDYLRLAPNSPAVNMGSNERYWVTIRPNTSDPTPTDPADPRWGNDLDGNRRIQGTTIDLGPYEHVSRTPDASASGISAEPAANVIASGTEASIITITVVDAVGNPLAGEPVYLAVSQGEIGDGVLSSSGLSKTGTDGTAVIELTSTTVGEVEVTAYLGEDADGEEIGAATVGFVAGPATQLHILEHPVAGASGAVLATQPIIQVRDVQGNVVTDDNDTQVTISIKSGSAGTLGGTVTVTAENGVATFSNLTLSGIIHNPYVLEFTANPTLTARESKAVLTGHGTATRLMLESETTDLPSGNTRQLTATLQDNAGNMVTTGAESTLPVTFMQQSGAGSAAGFSVTNAENGTAEIHITGDKAGTVSMVASTTSPELVSDLITFTITVDKVILAATIATATDLVKNDWSAETWSNLENAWNDAEDVVDDPNTTQSEINDATAALQDAMDNLTVDKYALSNAIGLANDLTDTDYSPDGWNTLQDALETAQAVYDNPNATQPEVDRALERLSQALDNLSAGNPLGAPTNPSAQAGNQAVSLAWRAPENAEGTPITDYLIQYTTDNGITWHHIDNGLSAATQTTLTGLANNMSYRFRIAAVNAAGTGAYSEPTEAVIPTASVPGENGELVVDELEQRIRFGPLPEKTYGDTNFALDATADSDLPVAYHVTDMDGGQTSIASIANGNQVRIHGAGQVRIVASQPGDGLYGAANEVSRTLAIRPATLAVSVDDSERPYGGENPAFDIRYSGFVNGDTPAALDSAPVAISTTGPESDVGEYPITLIGGESPNYLFDYTHATLTISRAYQEIQFPPVAVVERDAGNIPLDVRSSSGLPVVLSLDDEQVASLNGYSLDILRLGTVRITATQQGDGNYLPAEPVTVTLRVIDPTSDLPVRVHPAVSPNGDGINEFLMIEAITDYPDNRVTIFNRNGTVLWEASGYDNDRVAFRGIGSGQSRLQPGTYFYLIEVNDNGTRKQAKGYFVLRY